MKYTLLTILAFSTIISGCLTKKVDKQNVQYVSGPADAGDTTTDPLTTAQLEGTFKTACLSASAMGSAFNAVYYQATLVIDSNADYSLETKFFTETTCSLAGAYILHNRHEGDVNVDGFADTPSTATKLVFTQNMGGYFTVWNYAGGGVPTAWQTLMNNACNGAVSFVFADDQNMTGITCTDATLTTQVHGFINTVYYNIATLSGSTLTMSKPNFLIKSGNTSTYPTTLDYTFTKQ